MGNVRVQTHAATDLGEVHLWLARYRGTVVELDRGRRVALGAPISGARALISAVVLEEGSRPGAQLGGVLRVLGNPAGTEPVRLEFDGRSPSGLPNGEAHDVAASMLEAIAERIASDRAVQNVA